MSDDDYEVGYGHPPKSGQFKPGQSGNPRGRPRGIKNLATDLEEELLNKVLVTEGGAQQETTKQRAMLKTLFAKSLTGDVPATKVLIDLILGLEQTRIQSQVGGIMADEDLQILEAFKQRVLEEGQPEVENSDD